MLKTITESLEGISENLHDYYEQTDNGYVLQLDGIENHPELSRLKSALKKERDARADYEARLKAIPDDFDADQWRNVKAGKAKEEDLIKLRKELESEINQWKDKAQTYERQTYQLTVAQQLDETLKQNGIVHPAFQKAARAMLADNLKYEDGKVFADTDIGPIELAEHVKRWASTEGSVFVEPPKGGGASGGKAEGAGKSITQDQLAQMSPRDKAKFYRDNPGIQVTT